MKYFQEKVDKVPPQIQLFFISSLALKWSYDRFKHAACMLIMPRRNAIIPGRTSILMAAKTASQLALEDLDLDFSDSESEDFGSDSGDSDKEKKH